MHNNLLDVNFLTYRIITSKYTSKIAYNIIYLIKVKTTFPHTKKLSRISRSKRFTVRTVYTGIIFETCE